MTVIITGINIGLMSKENKTIELIKDFIVSKDKLVFAELYDLYIDDAYRFVYSRVKSKEVTEDIVSETFFFLIENLHKFNGKSKFSTFLFGIANNKIKQYYSRISKANNTISYNDDLFISNIHKLEKTNNTDNSNKLRYILNELPKHYRKVLELRYLYHYSSKQIALQMGISEGNARVIQNRAIKKAQKIIRKTDSYK